MSEIIYTAKSIVLPCGKSVGLICEIHKYYTKWGYKPNHRDFYFHRDNAPAYIYKGGVEWYQHDKLHRIDGPAIDGPDIMTEWYINGVRWDD